MIIDGAVTPDQIPDLTAYQLFFDASGVLPNATRAQLRLQTVTVAKIGLNDSDTVAFINEVDRFKVQYENLLAAHNRLADQAFATNMNPPNDNVPQAIANLTASTVGALQSALSKEGAATLAIFVTGEKKNIKIVPYAGVSQ